MAKSALPIERWAGPELVEGFTLLEVVIAMGLIMTSMVAIFGMAVYNLKAAESSRDQFLAGQLAQEGVEIVRSIRDSNWLANPDDNDAWLDGLVGDFRVQSFGPQGGAVVLAASDQTPLMINGDGYYNYDTGNNTAYFRKVNVVDLGDTARVTVTVSWLGTGGASNNLVVVDELKNWR